MCPGFGYSGPAITFAPAILKPQNKPSTMKKVFAIFAIAGVMVACNNSGEKKAEDIKDSATNVIENVQDSANKVIDAVVDSAAKKVDAVVDSAAKKLEGEKPKM
jgi:hypothetical protein